jgi:beta-glucanase (GH16 family)
VAKPKLIWSDEFNGPAGALPDPTKWGYEQGASGWGNNELECYTTAPGNVSQNGAGDLVITAIRQPGHICSDGKPTDYTSARILTQNKFTAKYGRLEVRAQVPTAPGTWPAFWALGANITTVQWPRAGEIDVMETIGKTPNIVYGTVHGPKSNSSPFSVQTKKDTGADLSVGFHTYAVDWTPDSLTFLLDGVAYGTVTKKDVEKANGTWVYDHDYYLLLNLAIGGNFPGAPTVTTTWPQKYTIDYVRVYS